MVELKTTPKLRAASASSTIESPSFNDLSRSNFLSCCGVPSNRNSVFDGLRRSFWMPSRAVLHQRQQTTVVQMSHMTDWKTILSTSDYIANANVHIFHLITDPSPLLTI